MDSDEEWEEVQDGESIDGSVANSDEEQDNDEYEVDNEVFVPHGYLSDEVFIFSLYISCTVWSVNRGCRSYVF